MYAQQEDGYYDEEEDYEEEEDKVTAGSNPVCQKCGKGILLKVRVFDGNSYYGCTVCSAIFGLMTYDGGATRVIGYGKGLRMEEMEIQGGR